MIGGQVVDLEAEHTKPDLATLEYIHRSKTAALIGASVVSGGLYAGGETKPIDELRSFGLSIGLAFQIVDDVLDVTQTSEQLGKTAGKDTAAEKATYPALVRSRESLKRADALVESALLRSAVLVRGREPERSGGVSGEAERISSSRDSPERDARAHDSRALPES